MIDAILKDRKATLVVSAYLSGEYGLDGICIGVPCKIGKSGIEEVVKLELSEDEAAAFQGSAEAIRDSIKLLYDIG